VLVSIRSELYDGVYVSAFCDGVYSECVMRWCLFGMRCAIVSIRSAFCDGVYVE
jgi:hypothetical protein